MMPDRPFKNMQTWGQTIPIDLKVNLHQMQLVGTVSVGKTTRLA